MESLPRDTGKKTAFGERVTPLENRRGQQRTDYDGGGEVEQELAEILQSGVYLPEIELTLH